MDILVDRLTWFQFPTPPTDLFQAVTFITDGLRDQGRAVVSVRYDGRAVSSTDLPDTLQGKSIEQPGILEVDSEDLRALIDSCLAELETALPDLPGACHRLAEVFRGEDPDAGYEPFYQLAEIWQVIKEREQLVVTTLDLDFDALEIESTTLRQMRDELNLHLQAAAEALTNHDSALLGNLLESELAPRAEAETRIVALLRSQLS